MKELQRKDDLMSVASLAQSWPWRCSFATLETPKSGSILAAAV